MRLLKYRKLLLSQPLGHIGCYRAILMWWVRGHNWRMWPRFSPKLHPARQCFATSLPLLVLARQGIALMRILQLLINSRTVRKRLPSTSHECAPAVELASLTALASTLPWSLFFQNFPHALLESSLEFLYIISLVVCSKKLTTKGFLAALTQVLCVEFCSLSNRLRLIHRMAVRSAGIPRPPSLFGA